MLERLCEPPGLVGRHLAVVDGMAQPESTLDLSRIDPHGPRIGSLLSTEQGPIHSSLMRARLRWGLPKPDVEVEDRVEARRRMERGIGLGQRQRRQEAP